MTLIVVLLPAPFGPRKPKISPRRTSKEMPSTARMSGSNTLTRFFTRMIAWDGATTFEGTAPAASGVDGRVTCACPTMPAPKGSLDLRARGFGTSRNAASERGEIAAKSGIEGDMAPSSGRMFNIVTDARLEIAASF